MNPAPAALRLLARKGRFVLVAGLLIGIALPDLAQSLQPYIPQAAALMLFIGGAAGANHSGNDPAPIWIAAETATVPGQFVFAVLVLLAVTGEYATGAIRSTLQWLPSRATLLAARATRAATRTSPCTVSTPPAP